MESNRWTPLTNDARSRALRGRRKSLSTRAKMHASKLVPRDVDPELWDRLYRVRLRELQLRRHVLRVMGAA